MLILRILDEVLGDRKASLLDLGCGTGHLAGVLKAKGHRVVGLDQQSSGLARALQQDPLSSFLVGVAERLPFRAESFDVVLACDVLEHVEDAQSLAEIHRVLRAGGKLILTVPAHPWLWSRRDELAGHLRRYRAEDLRARVLGADFWILRWTAYQCLLFPLVVLSRIFGRDNPGMTELEELPGPLLNRLLGSISRFEGHLAKFIPMPWGSSFVLLVEKR